MARTYPAKRSRIATKVDAFRIVPFPGPDGTTWTTDISVRCTACDDLIAVGARIVDGPLHARCADAGEALP